MLKVICPALAGLLAVASTPAGAQGWKPERTVELIVGSSAGTGTDRVARLMERIWREKKVMDVPVTVVNRPGGGGAVSWAYLTQRSGDPHHLLITSYNIVTAHISGRSKITYTDFTPISLMAREYIVYSVRADSPVKSIADLYNVLKKDPAAFAAGVSSAAGGANHIALGRLVKAGGIDVTKMKVVIFSGTNEALAGLLGGHVGIFINSASATAGAFKNGQIRPLAVAAPQRLGDIYATVPTVQEAGYPVVAENWRLAIAPKGITQVQAAYWEGALKRLTESEEWLKELERNYLPNNALSPADTERYIKEQYGEIKAILTDLGLASATTAR
jgi:putative tricarboxylic transport membrane protein